MAGGKVKNIWQGRHGETLFGPSMFTFWLALVLLVVHVLGAPKKIKPEERLWIKLRKGSKDLKKKAEKKLGNKLTQLYKQNKLAATDISDLLQTADEAGLEFENPIPKKIKFEPGQGWETTFEPEEGFRDKNAARSMDRYLRRNHNWTDLYWAKIPMKNPAKKANDLEERWLPFLLPHEWLSDYLLQCGAWDEAMPEEGTFVANRLAQACQCHKEPLGGMLPLGLHGDGVPVPGRMNQSSLDFGSVSLVASQKFGHIRIPICCLDARMICWTTIEKICQVVFWTFQCLAEGKFPTGRHDGSAWLKSDNK